MRKSATADLRSGRLEGSVRDVGGLMVRDALLRSAPHYEGESYRPKFLSNFNAKNFLRFLIPSPPGGLILGSSRSTRAVLQACLAGIGTGARGRGSLPRPRDGMGPRLRSLRAGARSSLTERLSPHEKRGLCREIAALERCEAPASRKRGKRKARCAVAALRPPRFLNEARAVMEECPGA